MSNCSSAASAVSLQAQALQSQIGTAVLKQKLNAQNDVLQLLQPAQTSQANLGAGVGSTLDVRA